MIPKFVSVKNFERYQRYVDRLSPWIKLYYQLLEDQVWMMLDEVQQCRYVKLLLVASRCENRISTDQTYLQNMLRVRKEIDLTPLIKTGFLVTFRAMKCDITGLKMSQNRHADIDIDVEVEKTVEIEKTVCVMSEFDEFWNVYPRKTGKKAARRAWDKASDRPPLQEILQTISLAKQSEQWRKDSGMFIPHPATWLNQGRWDDEVMVCQPKRPTSMVEIL